jgi:PPP family 3-phenylpropionic acid transporter
MRGSSRLSARSEQAAPLAAARLSGFYAAAFLVNGIQLPFWPVWLAARGLGPREIAFLFAAAIWAKVATAPAIGMIADRLGQRRAVMAALAAAALAAYLGLFWTAGLAALLALNLLALTAQSALMPLGDAVALGFSRTRTLDYGRVRVWGSVSFILASLVAGRVLAASSSERVLPLVLGASTLLLLACLGVPALPESNRGAQRAAWHSLGGVAANPRFWGVVATAAALQASHQVYYGFGTLYWRSLGFSDTAVGWLWAEGVLAEIVLFWQGGRLVARLGPAGLMALGGAAGVVRWTLAAALPGLPAAAALQLLHALTFGASHLGTMYFLSRIIVPESAAGAQTIYAAVSSGFGGGLVMLAAGALYALYGGHAYLFMALLSAIGLAGAVRLGRPPPSRRTPATDRTSDA